MLFLLTVKIIIMKDVLIIDRSKWRTGGDNGSYMTGYGDTQLLNKQGFMCCLGFRCNQLGIPKSNILEEGEPEHITDRWKVIPDLIEYDRNTPFTSHAIDLNDSPSLTHKEREKKIKDHFRTIKVTVQFKGKYVIPK